MRETRVGDQSIHEAAPQCGEHACGLVRAGRHTDHCRNAPQIVQVHGEDAVVHHSTDRLTGGVEEATARGHPPDSAREDAAVATGEAQVPSAFGRRARAQRFRFRPGRRPPPGARHDLADRRLGQQGVACRVRMQQGRSVEVSVRRTEAVGQIPDQVVPRRLMHRSRALPPVVRPRPGADPRPPPPQQRPGRTSPTRAQGSGRRGACRRATPRPGHRLRKCVLAWPEHGNADVGEFEPLRKSLLEISVPTRLVLDADLHDPEGPRRSQHAGDVGAARSQYPGDVVLGPAVEEVHAGGLDKKLPRARAGVSHDGNVLTSCSQSSTIVLTP